MKDAIHPELNLIKSWEPSSSRPAAFPGLFCGGPSSCEPGVDVNTDGSIRATRRKLYLFKLIRLTVTAHRQEMVASVLRLLDLCCFSRQTHKQVNQDVCVQMKRDLTGNDRLTC